MDTNDNITTNQHILFFAFKYSLNRKSSAPSMVMTSIMKNMNKLTENEIERYINEIEGCKSFGLDKDKENWLSLAANLKKEIELMNF